MKKNDNYYLQKFSINNNDFEGQNRDKKLLLYKNINDASKKSEFCYYYNEGDNEMMEKFLSNKNNLKYMNNYTNKDIINNNYKNNYNTIVNNEQQKRKSLINYVSKDDKSKNLFVYEDDNSRRLGLNRNRKNKYYEDNKVFDIRYLRNIKANKFNIISQKYLELPISSVCYFKKRHIPPKIPILSKCYFNKTTIVRKKFIMETIVNNCYFCTKVNKEKFKVKYVIEKNIGFNYVKPKRRYNYRFTKNKLKKSKNKNENLKKNNKSNRKQEIEAKIEEYKMKKKKDINSLLKEDIFNFLLKNNKSQYLVSKTEKDPKNMDFENNNDKMHNLFLKSSTSFNKKLYSYNNNTPSKYSFKNAFNVRTNKNSANDKLNKKKILQKFIDKDQRKNKTNNEKDNKKIMPKINMNISKNTPNSKTLINTQSSRFLIKKINSTNLKNGNNSRLFSVIKRQNNLKNTNDNLTSFLLKSQKNNYKDFPGIINNNNNNNNNKDNEIKEFSSTKYDRHFGNTENCPKCQSMEMKINYLKEKSYEQVQNVMCHHIINNNNTFNRTLDSFRRYNMFTPMKFHEKLYFKNFNNHLTKNPPVKQLHKSNSNSYLQIRKINIKSPDNLLKDYKSNLLAIKEYFNIK